MEKINSDNYERYMMDYLEGQLSPGQAEELEHFLDANPGLREEMKDLEQMYLVPAAQAYDGKDRLKKQLTLDEPGYSHFDELCISRVEGTLTPSQEEVFDRMLDGSAEKQKIYRQYALTRLQPDLSAKYPDKASLKKKHHKILSAWGVYSVFSLAASVVLLVALYVLLPSPHETTMPSHSQKTGINVREVPVAENPSATNPMDIEATIPLKIDYKKLSSQLIIEAGSGGIPFQKEAGSEAGYSEADGLETDRSLASLKPMKPQLGIDASDPVAYAGLAVPHMPGDEQPASRTEFDTYQKLDRFFERRVNYALQQRPEFSIWDIAGAGLKGISKITGKELALERRYNQQGELQTLAFKTENFSLSTKIKE
jgi:hypothetical protein